MKRIVWQILKFIWQSSASVVALVLIIIAFAIGVRFGFVFAPETQSSTQAASDSGVSESSKPTMFVK